MRDTGRRDLIKHLVRVSAEASQRWTLRARGDRHDCPVDASPKSTPQTSVNK